MERRNNKWLSPNKNLVRSQAVRYRGKTYKIALFFTGGECCDLKEAKKNRIITHKTFIIIVERDSTLIKQIKRNLKSLDFTKYHIHNGPVETLDLDEVLGNQKLEFAFFDICGNITYHISKWLNENQDHFADDIVFPFTLSIHGRGRRGRKNGTEPQFEYVVKRFVDRKKHHCDYPFLKLLDNDLNSDKLMHDLTFACDMLFYAFSRKELDLSVAKAYLYKHRNTPMMMVDITIKGKKQLDKIFDKVKRYYDEKEDTEKNLLSKKNKKKYKTGKGKDNIVTCCVKKYKRYENIPYAVRAHITRYALATGKSKAMVHAGLKAAFTRKNRKAS